MNSAYVAINLPAESHLLDNEQKPQSCKLNLLTLDVSRTWLSIFMHG